MPIEVIICLISLIVGYIFNRFQERHSEKYTRKSERFEKLYAPFVKKIFLDTQGAFQLSDLDPLLQRQFFELLFNNYEYADSELKELLQQFKWVYDIPAANDKEEANKCFFMIEQRIFAVFEVLSKEMFLEPYCIKKMNRIAKQWEKLP